MNIPQQIMESIRENRFQKIKYEGTYDNEIVYNMTLHGNIISDGKYEYSYDNLNRLQQITDLSKYSQAIVLTIMNII